MYQDKLSLEDSNCRYDLIWWL